MVFDFWTYFTSSIAHLLIIALAFFLMLQLVYYWLVFSRLAFKRLGVSEEVSHPVSVIVCARNEYQNLKEYLPLVLEQDYPKYEVILINDDSDDDTEFLVRDLSLKYPHFRVVNIDRSVSFIKGKKFALSIGIKESRYNHLLLTDADCLPASSQWIQSMQQGFTDKAQIVVGYGQYEQKPGLLNRFVRFDTIHTALQYLSFTLAKSPYMGVGRNLSYTKSLFESQKGFTSHYMVQYGDDDLFVNKAADRKNTVAVYHPNAHTVSIAPKSWGAWFRQKKRHLATGKHYRFSTKIKLGFYPFSALFFYLTFGVVLFLNIRFFDLVGVGIISGLFLIRLVSQIVVFAGACKKLNEKGVVWLTPIFDLIFTILNPLWAFSNVIIKQNKWK